MLCLIWTSPKERDNQLKFVGVIVINLYRQHNDKHVDENVFIHTSDLI